MHHCWHCLIAVTLDLYIGVAIATAPAISSTKTFSWLLYAAMISMAVAATTVLLSLHCRPLLARHPCCLHPVACSPPLLPLPLPTLSLFPATSLRLPLPLPPLPLPSLSPASLVAIAIAHVITLSLPLPLLSLLAHHPCCHCSCCHHHCPLCHTPPLLPMPWPMPPLPSLLPTNLNHHHHHHHHFCPLFQCHHHPPHALVVCHC